MANKRIYFANQMVAFARDGSQPGRGRKPASADTQAWIAAHGVQSVGVTTTFNLEQAFEVGQLSIYENIEGVPDVEVTASKVLDGYPLLYHFATNEGELHGHGPTLAGRSAASCLMALGVWPDTADSATGVPGQQMEASGLFCSSIGYNFPTEDNFTEDITLVGNNKAWIAVTGQLATPDGTRIGKTHWRGCSYLPWSGAVISGNLPSGEFDNNDAPIGYEGSGVQRREDMAFAPALTDMTASNNGFDYCRLPTDIPGIDSSGWMSPKASNNEAHISNISVSTDLGREDLFELGTRQPYTRPVSFPVEVTCDIEVISVSGDLVNAFADGCGDGVGCEGIKDNLNNQVIRLATCEGTRIYLGAKNKLASVNYGGGDAGGGNVSVTYSYTTFNDFTVLHWADQMASGGSYSGQFWWQNRARYLGSGNLTGLGQPMNSFEQNVWTK